MKLRQAGERTMNPGRYSYKCPRNIDHTRSFIWCDEYHQHDSPETMSSFLQVSNLSSKTDVSGSSSGSLSFTPNHVQKKDNGDKKIDVNESVQFTGHVQDLNGLSKRVLSLVFLGGCVAMAITSICIAMLSFLVGRWWR